MTRILYDVALHFFALFSLPKLLWNRSRYRGTLAARLGFGFPKIEKKGQKLIWVHAVSMGEVKAVAPLIQKFKERSYLVLVSTSTKTGFEEGKKSGADWTVYLPFDFSYVIDPIMRRICPDLVVLTETDFWYHFQSTAKKRGAQLVLVNGKISERSFQRYQRFPFIARFLLSSIDCFYVQGPLYQRRFQEIGVPAEKIVVTGNMKLDAPAEKISPLPKEQLGLVDQYVITLGSTHAPEERIWLEALQKLWQHQMNLKVFIAPRHPERFNEVARLLAENRITYGLWSQQGTLHTRDVLLVDTVGALKQCYQLSDLTFVGGSFTPKVGGHNILEPAFFGKPVLYGPYIYSQPELADLVERYRAGLQIAPEDIITTVNRLIADPGLAHQMGRNGLRLIAESRGTLDKIFDSLQCLLEKSGP
ncbi:MAG: 3-deoxy-D-manno-octulosonic acid transferase [Chlamydiales bacterium]|nr:3-deoxy-D-manno-octulosonic acid transferase [Chlamydiales bacterium]